MAPDDPHFELEWTKRKLDGSIHLLNLVSHENDILRGMVEHVISRFDQYTVGDLWTQEDMMVLVDVKEQLEDIE